MKKKIVGIFVCTLLIATVVPAVGIINERELYDENQLAMEFTPGEFIVKLKEDASFSNPSLTTLNEKHQVYAIEKVFPNVKDSTLDTIYLLHVPIASDILSMVQEFMTCSDVVYAQPNGIIYLDTIQNDYDMSRAQEPMQGSQMTECIPNDTNFSIQWGLHNTGQVFFENISGTPDADIDAPEAWDMAKGSFDVIVAIVDSGIDYTHPDLADNIWNNEDEIPGNGIDDDGNGYIDDAIGWDFYYNDNDPKDGYWHGTFIAGVVGAVTNNSIGIAGTSWNCRIMPVQVFNENGGSELDYILNGMTYAADNGAKIMGLAFHAPNSSLLKDTVDYVYNKGVFLACACGNDNDSEEHYPAAYENVVAVAGTNQDDQRCTKADWWYGLGSNYGEWVNIAAPASFIYSTMPTYPVTYNNQYNPYTLQKFAQNYDWIWGNCLPTQYVAGTAALLLATDPSLTPDELTTLLCENVDPYNSTEYIGTGRLNAQKALIALLSLIDVDFKAGLGLGVKAIITNTGLSDVTDVDWQIHVEGGILGLINKTVSGSVDIVAGDAQTVASGLFLGFGPITISVKAADKKQTVNGTQVFIFSMVKK